MRSTRPCFCKSSSSPCHNASGAAGSAMRRRREPVSYTHLDVYKRQKLFRSANAWQAWFLNFQQSFLILLAPWLVSVLVQSAGRVYLLATYAPPGAYATLSQDCLLYTSRCV